MRGSSRRCVYRTFLWTWRNAIARNSIRELTKMAVTTRRIRGRRTTSTYTKYSAVNATSAMMKTVCLKPVINTSAPANRHRAKILTPKNTIATAADLHVNVKHMYEYLRFSAEKSASSIALCNLPWAKFVKVHVMNSRRSTRVVRQGP
jgi:hypothetical protein